ncbi:Fc.00g106670.m01.CDS01 [Cosmosporella sp. VM-42]
MSYEPGTIVGYDQLLTISQEAINRQLEALYRSPVRPVITDGPKYLINHEMRLNSDWGEIRGYICCPKIEFFGGRTEPTGPESSSNFAERGIMNFIGYDTGDGFAEVLINGWELSWDSLIDTQEVADVMKDILNLASSADSNVALSSEAKSGLEAVNSSNFMVSTIFCAMEEKRLIKSLVLRDEQGRPPTDVRDRKGQPVHMEDFKSVIIETLCGEFTPRLQPGTQAYWYRKAARPTPNNPFILGYTISQEKPQSFVVNPAAAAARIPTPAFFIPKSFRNNITPASSSVGGSLNYCMLTHRAMQPPSFEWRAFSRLPGEGPNLGEDLETYFQQIKSKAVPGSSEGALFFCQDIFVNHWIGSSVAPLFYVPPEIVGRQVVDLIRSRYRHANAAHELSFQEDVQNPEVSLSRDNCYRMKSKLDSKRKIIGRNPLQDPTESIKLKYETEIEITYENLHPLRDDDDDLKRRLKFTIGSYTSAKLIVYRRLATSHFSKFFEKAGSMASGSRVDYLDDSNWEEAYISDVWLNYSHTFEVGTSAANRGSFTVENPKSAHRDDNGNLKGYKRRPDWPREPGMFQKTESKNWANWFEFAFEEELEQMGRIGEETAGRAADLFKGALEDLVKGLGTAVILPAGDVFMFKGMSCDTGGNVFTSITYATPIGGKVRLHPNYVKGWLEPDEAPAGSDPDW